MPPNKSSTDMAMDMVTDVASGLGKLGMGLAALASEKLRTSPEDQLRAHNLPGYWRQTIGEVECPSCGTANEFFSPVCFSCGHDLWKQ